MRRLLTLSALVLTSACVHLPPLLASQADQAVANDPRSATAEVAKVRLTVRPDEWRGWPDDLEGYATPVEVIVQNGSDKEIAIRHAHFSLIVPGGFRYDALSPSEVRHLVRSTYVGSGGYWYYGAYGVYPWPGLYMPYPYYYPYVWWGDPWWGDPWFGAPPPPPPRPSAITTPSGKLAAGGRVSILVFFPIPAARVSSCTFEAQVVATDGTNLGTVQLPFERRTPGKGLPVSASPVQAPPAKAGAPPP